MEVHIYSSVNAESRAGNIWVKDIMLGFIQAVLLMSVFELRLSFQMLLKAGEGLKVP